jgi:hypothetical protein
MRIVAVTAFLAPAILAAQSTPPTLGANRAGRLSERARQDREIVYFLQQPETHAFDLYHDYTESRPGVDNYLNVVRGGSAGVESVGLHPRHRREAHCGNAPRRENHRSEAGHR